MPVEGNLEWDKFIEEFGLPNNFTTGAGPVPIDIPGGGTGIAAEFSSEANGLL